jgi:hypothetical protein
MSYHIVQKSVHTLFHGSGSRIHELTISLRFLGIILIVLGFRIQCLHYKPVSNHFCPKGGGGGGSKIQNLLLEVIVNGKEENSKTFVPITSKNSASGYGCILQYTVKYSLLQLAKPLKLFLHYLDLFNTQPWPPPSPCYAKPFIGMKYQ